MNNRAPSRIPMTVELVYSAALLLMHGHLETSGNVKLRDNLQYTTWTSKRYGSTSYEGSKLPPVSLGRDRLSVSLFSIVDLI